MATLPTYITPNREACPKFWKLLQMFITIAELPLGFQQVQENDFMYIYRDIYIYVYFFVD